MHVHTHLSPLDVEQMTMLRDKKQLQQAKKDADELAKKNKTELDDELGQAIPTLEAAAQAWSDSHNKVPGGAVLALPASKTPEANGSLGNEMQLHSFHTPYHSVQPCATATRSYN